MRMFLFYWFTVESWQEIKNFCLLKQKSLVNSTWGLVFQVVDIALFVEPVFIGFGKKQEVD
jgi:hypothetical protein